MSETSNPALAPASAAPAPAKLPACVQSGKFAIALKQLWPHLHNHGSPVDDDHEDRQTKKCAAMSSHGQEILI